MKSLLCLLVLIFSTNFLMASELNFQFHKNVKNEDKEVLINVIREVDGMLPESFKNGLPVNIELKIEKLSKSNQIPTDLCDVKSEGDKKEKFVYGEYSSENNSLKLNVALINEFKKGKSHSAQIKCQHKNLYDQALSTIIHELAHAYDIKNNVSSDYSFVRKAGFKKTILGIRNKNVKALRSEDQYELKNIKESFAVNFEYFVMDSEFMCRRPSMFDYYKKLLKNDPFPNRNCKLNSSVMLTTQQGLIPFKLDPKRVYRIDYLLASKGKELSSGFGHAMFRLVVCAPDRIDPLTMQHLSETPYGKKCENDQLYHVVVSYRANIEGSNENYLKGIFGGYPSILFMLPLTDVLNEYNKDELRDLMAYPLKLSEVEKTEIVKKIIEEHWNYRGSYKFFTNNCATESFDLLKASLDRSDVNQTKTVTPYGMLENLTELGLLDPKDPGIETFKTRSDLLIGCMKITYGIKNKSDKKDKKDLLVFIDESKVDDRAKKIENELSKKIPSLDAHAELFEYKKMLLKATAFSIIEQQILRTKVSDLRKKVAEIYSSSDDENINKMFKKSQEMANKNINDLIKNGYGVPLESEMIKNETVINNIEEMSQTNKEVEQFFKEKFSDDYENIDKISNLIKSVNENSIRIRIEFKKRLDIYVLNVLTNLRSNDVTLKLLIDAKDGNKESILKIRELLDAKIITENEITDKKIISIISQLLN